MDIIIVITALLGVLGTGLVGYLQYQSVLPRRSALRAELEILKLMDEKESDLSPEGRAKLVESINRRIVDIYLKQPEGIWAIIFLVVATVAFSVSAIGLAFWTYTLVEHPFNWWSIGTGVSAIYCSVLARSTSSRLAARRPHQSANFATGNKAGKNIVVLLDGIARDGGVALNTNVGKLFGMVEDSEKQIAFYDLGLETAWARKISNFVFGTGMAYNTLECYQFILENYEAGDQVFLFGFGRGAATARSLSSFIDLFGILPKYTRPDLIKRAYKIYGIPDDAKRARKAAEFLRLNYTMYCRIKFLGVWETVSALGIPIKLIDVFVGRVPSFRYRFHDLRLSNVVEHGRQALAIDDERLTFHPVFWDTELHEGQTVKQVWFCGMHTDVGGRYFEQDLSDIPLIWMLTEAKEYGLLINPRNKVTISPDPNGPMHDSRAGMPGRFYRRRERSWETHTRGKPTDHESVLLRNEVTPSYDPWILHEEYEVEPWPE